MRIQNCIGMFVAPVPISLPLRFTGAVPIDGSVVTICPIPLPCAILIRVPLVIVFMLGIVIAMIVVLRHQIGRREKSNT